MGHCHAIVATDTVQAEWTEIFSEMKPCRMVLNNSGWSCGLRREIERFAFVFEETLSPLDS